MKKLILLGGITFLMWSTSSAQCPGSNALSYGCQVGRTYYGLQTNGASPNRVAINPDGSISVVWTQSKTNVSQPIGTDRGFGYNHWDGMSWNSNIGECGTSNHGCASNYVGWPEIINNPGGMGDDEIVISHNNGSGTKGLSKTSRPTIGSGSWNSTTSLDIDSVFDMKDTVWVKGATWPRAVNVGDTIHMIAAFEKGIAGSVTIDSNGIENPLRYYRSTDGGQSWDITNYDFAVDGLDSHKVKNIRGDAYAITARGNTVAVTFGSWKNHWMLYKSTDGGSTWTETIIKDYTNDLPLAIEVYELYEVNDDAHAVSIDHNGKVHAYCGGMIVAENNGIIQFYMPHLDVGIKYWQEGMIEPIVIAKAPIDIQGISSMFSPTDTTWDVPLDMGVYFLGPSTMPSVGINGPDQLVCVFSAPVEGTSHTGDTLGKAFRDLYAVFSTDGGFNWCGPFNIAEVFEGLNGGTPFEEDVYPSISVFNNRIHVIWEGDYEPGIWPSSGAIENYIHHMSFSYPAVLLASCTAGVNESAENSINIFPNPSTGLVSIESKRKLSPINIYNTLGERLRSMPFQQQIDISNLATGFYIIEVDGYRKKILKQ